MFIDWAAQLNLLEHNPETHILKEFSLSVQKVLVQQVASFLLGGTNAQKSLTSEAHVCWAMEVCGQGFLLPIEEAESIGKVITLYRIWVLESKHGPRPLENNKQFFLQKIIQQSSLLFEPRQSPKELTDRHAALCSQVLDIYSNIGRILGSEMSTETWEIFLKILIGLSDAILHKDAPASVEPLQRKLVGQLQKVIFESWLLSRTRNPALWEALQQRVRGWTDHTALILTWKVVSFSLTKRTVNILYNTSKNESVVIKFDDSVQHIPLENEYVFYAWHRILNLIGNPNETIMKPANILAFMNGLEIVVTQFLKVGISLGEETKLIAPTGNTILHLFGHWLVDCILLNRPGFEEGTALALKILSNIMITCHKSDLLPIYVSSYFSCIQRALGTEGRVLVSAITSSTSIFTKEIKGVRCLVPLFFEAIQKVLSGRIKSIENVMPSEHFRKACLQIFSTIISFPNHLGRTKFATSNITTLEVPDYLSLKPHYSTLLTESLTKETNLSNIEFLLNLSYMWVIEDIDNNCDFAKQLIGLIIRKITQNRWGPDVTSPALSILIQVAKLYPKIDKGYEQANLVVDQLCRLIISIGNPPASNMENIAILAFRCISHWIMVDQWLFNHKETRHALLVAIVAALTGKKNQQDPTPEPVVQIPASSSKKKDKKKKHEEKQAPIPKTELKNQPEPSVFIQEAAQSTLMAILNHLGNFPTLSGATVISTLAVESEILQEIIQESGGTVSIEQTKEFMRYYITDDRLIICAIDRPYHVNGPCTCVIVRDKTGRYAWDTTLTYSAMTEDNQETIYHEEDIPITITPFQPTKISQKDVKEVSNILNYLSKCNTSSAFKPVSQQVQKEYSALKRNNFGLNSDISTAIPKAADSYAGHCKFQKSRMFMSHMGYLSLENRANLFPLEMNSGFFKALQQLDEKAERICIKVGVLFGRKGQTEEEWYFNENGSLDYQEFISTLGWGVNISDHRGFKGNIPGSGCTTAPYWADYATEVLFQVTTLAPNKGDGSHKRQLALQSSALVIWLEEFGTFQAQLIWKHVRYNIVIIVIVPLEFGLYSVRIFSQNDNPLGPLSDGCVLSKATLGCIVRDTCIFSWHQDNANKPSPVQARIECIDRIYDQFKGSCTVGQFYTSQFTSLGTDEIGPLQSEGAAREQRMSMISGASVGSSVKQSASPRATQSRPAQHPSMNLPVSKGPLDRGNSVPVVRALQFDSNYPTDQSINRSNRPAPPSRAPPPRGGRQVPPPSNRPPPGAMRGRQPLPPSRTPATNVQEDGTSGGSWVGSRTTPSQQGAKRGRPPKLFGTQRQNSFSS